MVSISRAQADNIKVHQGNYLVNDISFIIHSYHLKLNDSLWLFSGNPSYALVVSLCIIYSLFEI